MAEPLAALELSLSTATAGVVSEAEGAVRDLNSAARPALAPLARLLLRTEAIASSAPRPGRKRGPEEPDRWSCWRTWRQGRWIE